MLPLNIFINRIIFLHIEEKNYVMFQNRNKYNLDILRIKQRIMLKIT